MSETERTRQPRLFALDTRLSPYQQGRVEGRAEERAAVVAWLRQLEKEQPPGSGLLVTYGNLAERADAGEHLTRRKGAPAHE